MTPWKLSQSRRGLRPLVVDSQGLLCYANGSIYRVGYDLKQLSFVCKLPSLGFISWLGNRVRLVARIFRSTPTHAFQIDNILYISRRSEIWRCDLDTGQIALDFVIPNGRRALQFSRVDLPDGEVQLIFGEYFSNPSRQPVRLWGRSSRSNQWEVKGEFSAGEIDHVHAVTAIGDRVFILCGDFERAASIWVTDNNFSCITPLMCGRQIYRACWIRELGGRFFYATDTQLESNHIFELIGVGGIDNVHEIAAINGSSIYSGYGKYNHYFSTAVECGMPTGNFVRDIFETRRGPGILSDNACIYCIDSNGYCQLIFSVEKDVFPFRLAQFGAFSFPTGVMPDNMLVAYGTALKKFDDVCLIFTR